MLKEIQVEDEEELVFVVMVEVKTCHREIWSIIDKIECGYHQLMWRGRSNIRLEMPPEPEPSRFLDWSSFGIIARKNFTSKYP